MGDLEDRGPSHLNQRQAGLRANLLQNPAEARTLPAQASPQGRGAIGQHRARTRLSICQSRRGSSDYTTDRSPPQRSREEKAQRRVAAATRRTMSLSRCCSTRAPARPSRRLSRTVIARPAPRIGRSSRSRASWRSAPRPCGDACAGRVRASRDSGGGSLHLGLALVQMGRTSILEIAHACGYESPSKFAARFAPASASARRNCATPG